MSDEALVEALARARARRDGAAQALGRKHVGGEWDEYRAAHAACLEAERALAAARGEEHAAPCALGPRWDVGAPLPHVVASERGVLLAYCVAAPDPAWDGTRVRVAASADRATPVAVVGFRWPTAFRMGPPNDEVLAGHPLHGRGLEAYRAHLVANSRWLGELEAINRVHPGYRPERWRARRHYLLTFHDTTFECIAEGHVVEVHAGSLDDAVRAMTARILDPKKPVVPPPA